MFLVESNKKPTKRRQQQLRGVLQKFFTAPRTHIRWHNKYALIDEIPDDSFRTKLRHELNGAGFKVWLIEVTHTTGVEEGHSGVIYNRKTRGKTGLGIYKKFLTPQSILGQT